MIIDEIYENKLHNSIVLEVFERLLYFIVLHCIDGVVIVAQSTATF